MCLSHRTFLRYEEHSETTRRMRLQEATWPGGLAFRSLHCRAQSGAETKFKTEMTDVG